MNFKKLARYFGYVYFLNIFFILLFSLELFTGTGVIHKYLFFSNSIFQCLGYLFTGVTLVVIFLVNVSGNILGLIDKYKKMLLYLLFGLISIFLLFLYVETVHYPNYVYSTFHLNLLSFSELIKYLLLTNIINILLVKSNLIKIRDYILWFLKLFNKSIHFNFKLLLWVTTTICLLVFFIYNLNKTYVFIMSTTVDTSLISKLNYNQKEEKIFGFIYKYSEFIKGIVPENGKILIPPMKHPWESEGNVPFMLYFLYPRNLIQGDLDVLNKGNYNYVLIAKGSWVKPGESDFGWPRVLIKSKEIWYFYPDTGKVDHIYNAIYDPNDEKNKNAWGLIKLGN